MILRPGILLLILLLPFLDLYLMIKVGSMIGPLLAVFLVVFTSVLGFFILRYQGVNTMSAVNRAVQNGEMPERYLIEGAIMMFGAILLLLPGFITDIAGVVTLVPFFRRRVAMRMQNRFLLLHPEIHVHESEGKTRHTIEGEFRRDE